MGKILQIRVSASTFAPAEVERAWPKLLALAYKEAPANPEVLDLVTTLDEMRRFGDWPPGAARDLGQGIDALVALRDELETALADWEPQAANRVSDEIEDTLTELEKLAPKP